MLDDDNASKDHGDEAAAHPHAPSEFSDPLCGACGRNNPEGTRFCAHCGAPIGPLSVVNPLDSVRAEGYMYRKTTTEPTKPIVLFGVWLLNIPALVFCGVMIVVLLTDRPSAGTIPIVLIFIALACVAGLLLYRSTKSYYEGKRKEAERAASRRARGPGR